MSVSAVQQQTFLTQLLHDAPLEDLLALLAHIAQERAPGTICWISLDGVAPHSFPPDPAPSWHRPIRSRTGRVVGSIAMSMPKGRPANDPRLLLDSLASLAALAYDHARLPAELTESRRLTELAVRISEIQTKTFALPAMLQHCAEALVQKLDMAFARIWLLNEAEQVLVVAGSAGLSTNLHGNYSRVPVATSLKISRMVRDRQPLLTNQILNERWLKEPEWAKREGLVAYAGYPLIADNRVVGVMAMFAKHPLPDKTLEALAAIAGGLAQSIIRSLVDEERRATLVQLQERVKELRALHETASLLHVNDPAPQLLQRVVALLPAAWAYPEIAEARITFAGETYQTAGFRDSPWRQRADFRLSDGQAGSLEVVYLEARPAAAEGPFAREERRLIDSLAEMLRTSLERRRSEEALRESRDLLQQLNATLEGQVRDRTAQLLAKQDQLRSLAVELSRTEERERGQLATALHDNLAQLLALGKMKLQDQPHSPVLAGVTELLDEALTYTRSVMADLRPPLLSDAQDLHRAIAWVVDRVQRRGLHVSMEGGKEPIELDEEVLTVTYQTIHELLFNVLKHAGSAQAILTLERGPDHLAVVVKDQGAGFDVQRHAAGSKHGGFGLLNIRERIELLGGRLEISSRLGEGTSVKVIVPLKAAGPSAVPSRTPEAAHLPEPPPHRSTDDAVRPLRILLVDDHQMVREGLRSLIERHMDLLVAAEASDGQTAVTLAHDLRPDVILMDVNMPKMNGLEATRRITADDPDLTVIGFSMHADAKIASAMRAAGAADYVAKWEAADKLVAVIREAWAAKTGRPASSSVTPSLRTRSTDGPAPSR